MPNMDDLTLAQHRVTLTHLHEEKDTLTKEICRIKQLIAKETSARETARDVTSIEQYARELKNTKVCFTAPNITVSTHMLPGFGIECYRCALTVVYGKIELPPSPSGAIDQKLYPYVVARFGSEFPMSIRKNKHPDRWDGHYFTYSAMYTKDGETHEEPLVRVYESNGTYSAHISVYYSYYM